MAAAKKATQYVVTAPLVAATVGKTVLHFYSGDILPAGVDEDSLENLKGLGFVTEVEAPVEPESDDK